MDDTNINLLAPSVLLGVDPEDSFKHKPLKPESDEVRLLRVYPELSTDGLIQCSLQHASLSSSRYICLSYTWGKPNGLKSILINGKPMKIRRMLSCFLQLARERQYGPLWIDALCINQEDNKERSRQVRLMGKIYSTAKRVLAYLGHGHASIERVLKLLQNVKTLLSIGRNDRQLLARVPYFKRQWIKQEIVLARSVMLLYGCVRCPWQIVDQMYKQAISPKSVQAMSTSMAMIYMKPIFHLAEQRLRSSGSLNRGQGLMYNHLDGECCNVRDRIYATLAMYKDGDTFPVDYTCPIPDLILRTAEFCSDQITDAGIKPWGNRPFERWPELCQSLVRRFHDVLTDAEEVAITEKIVNLC